MQRLLPTCLERAGRAESQPIRKSAQPRAKPAETALKSLQNRRQAIPEALSPSDEQAPDKQYRA
jgi:hypothetical protein